ncbi:MAG: tryptophan--tRNA ligase, partial [Ignavibacteriales bacterium]|nr:tryptophan--tRNA ligase [Ignavibacteriales bacterium]
CRSGSLGCVDCKNRCASSLNEFLEPFRERRCKYENDMNLVKDILHDGEQKALQVAKDTMNEVHKAMNLG